jgi:hypothetical protein
MSPTRLILIALSLVLVVIGLWQYSLSASAPAGSGSMNFWIAIGCVAAAGGALLGFFLLKPEEDPGDISITKF